MKIGPEVFAIIIGLALVLFFVLVWWVEQSKPREWKDMSPEFRKWLKWPFKTHPEFSYVERVPQYVRKKKTFVILSLVLGILVYIFSIYFKSNISSMPF